MMTEKGRTRARDDQIAENEVIAGMILVVGAGLAALVALFSGAQWWAPLTVWIPGVLLLLDADRRLSRD